MARTWHLPWLPTQSCYEHRLPAGHYRPEQHHRTVRVFDNVGRLVFTQTVAAGTAEVTVQPAQPLASGMYFATWSRLMV